MLALIDLIFLTFNFNETSSSTLNSFLLEFEIVISFLFLRALIFYLVKCASKF